MLKDNPVNTALINVLELSKKLGFKENDLAAIESRVKANKDDFTSALEVLEKENQALKTLIESGEKEEITDQLVRVMTPLQNIKFEIEDILEYIDNIFHEED